MKAKMAAEAASKKTIGIRKRSAKGCGSSSVQRGRGGRGFVQAICRDLRCGAVLNVALDGRPLGEMKRHLAATPGFVCPGGPHHVPGCMLHGFAWDWTVRPEPAALSDEAWVEWMQGHGHVMLGGERVEMPELPNIHDVAGLLLLPGGNLGTNTHTYRRVVSPRGTPFWVEEPSRTGRARGDGPA